MVSKGQTNEFLTAATISWDSEKQEKLKGGGNKAR